tara:strand:- start:282 stop:545 length:264 start_codon:yes stop_codon:yes gene_type:complete
MEIWTVVISMWLTTWFMAVSRTYSLIMRMISDEEGGKLIRDYRNTHAFIYGVSMIFIAPFIWQICFFEEPRRNFVVSYVKAIIRSKT